MVAMGIGDENVRYCFAAHGVEHGADMGRIIRARIDDRYIAASNDVSDSPLEGERPWIVGHDPAHLGHRLVHHIGREIEILVEWNIVVHAWRPLGEPAYHYFGHTCTLVTEGWRMCCPH